MKKLLALICSLVLLVGGVSMFSACGSDEDVIKVGVTLYPPMDYIDETTNEWTGFDAELAEKLDLTDARIADLRAAVNFLSPVVEGDSVEEEKTEAGDSVAGEEKNDPPEQEGKENTNGEV